MALAIQMSPEVEAALGPEMAVRVRNQPEGTCMECRKPLDSSEPVNAVLGQSAVATVGTVWLAHARCAPSRIVELNAEATAALVDPEGGTDMVMTPGMTPTGEPVLVAELARQVITDSGTYGSEPRNIFMQAMMQLDFALITHELNAPPMPEWVAVFTPHGRDLQLMILTPEAEQFFHGLITPPPGWIKAVLAGKQVLLLGGEVGISQDEDPQHHGEKLVAAARAGNLAGGRIMCGRATDYGLA